MKIITLNSSGISAYLQCPEKWNLAFNQGLILAEQKREAMDKGSAFHKLLELYYIERLNRSVFDAAKVAIEKYRETEEFKLVGEHQNFLMQRFTDYVIRYQSDDFNPIKLENIPSTEMGFSYLFYENQDVKYILEGKIDLISTIGQEMILVDHKTQSRQAELYRFKPQFLTYSLISGIRKLVVNYIGFQKNITDMTFRRTLITFPEHLIEQWRVTLERKFYEISLALGNGWFEKNQEACGGPFSSYHCQFTQLCELNPANQEMIANVKNFKYTVSPYESWSLPEGE